MLKQCFRKASQTSPKPAAVSPSCFTTICSLLPHPLTQIIPRAAARDAAASFFRVGNCNFCFHAELMCESIGHSVVSDLAHQAPLSRGFSRPEYWNGPPYPPPGDLPDARIKPSSPVLRADSLSLSPQGSLMLSMYFTYNKK